MRHEVELGLHVRLGLRSIAPYARSWVNKDRLVIRNEVMMVLMKALLTAKVHVS